MRVYLDACALSRLTDDPSQGRIKAEAEAVEAVLRRADSGNIQWLASAVLQLELSKNPDWDRRRETLAEIIVPAAATVGRANQLQSLGHGAFDALHLACAEGASADAFLTTDDRLIRRAQGGIGNVLVRVMNPIEFT